MMNGATIVADGVNRVTRGIARAMAVIATKNLSEAKLAELSKGLDMTFEEYCKFQTEKSVAGLDGRLTLDEAQTVYGYLGETLEHFNGQPLAVKWVLNELLAKILGERVAECMKRN